MRMIRPRERATLQRWKETASPADSASGGSELGLSQRALARRLAVSRALIVQLESGRPAWPGSGGASQVSSASTKLS